jgi:hypothetical protein
LRLRCQRRHGEAVHDSDLDGVEGADRRIFEGLAVHLGEQIEDAGEDVPGEGHIGVSVAGDLDLLGHGPGE